MTILFAALAVLLAAALAVAIAQIQHTLTSNWSNGSTTLASSVILTGQEELNIGIVIATGVTNQQITPFSFTLAKLQDIYILSDQDLTLKTNSTGSPQETLTIKANQPFAWYVGSGIPAPFAGNVTALYVTTGAIPASANLNIRTLVQSP
jgi:hypothetical protein